MPDQKQLREQPKNGKTGDKKKRTEEFRRFFTETKGELKKIVWPTPRKVVNNTLIVIFAIFIIGIFIWIIDAITSNGLHALLNTFGG